MNTTLLVEIVVFVVGALIQALTFAYFFGQLTARVSGLETSIARLQELVDERYFPKTKTAVAR